MAGGVRAWLGRRVAPPRFLVFLAVFGLALAGLTTFDHRDLADAASLAFDGAAAVFLLSLAPLLREHDAPDIRRHARENDANRVLVLVLSGLLVLVVLAAVAGELPEAAKGESGAIARLLATLSLAWLFANTVFAMHYAHLFYGPGDGGDAQGLDFSGDETPDYGDFLYFAMTLGMTFQTSDTGVTSRRMRRIVLVHSLTAFVFNLGILAFVINGLAGLAA